MMKYVRIAKNTWDEMFAYRTSFALYRIREFLQLFTTYFVWFFVTSQQRNFFGYTQSMMLTYILVGAFVNDVIFSTRTTSIAGEINEGVLTNYLIRPMSYFGYHFARDFGDKVLNIAFSLVELTLFFSIIHPPFTAQLHPTTLLIFTCSILLGVILNFFISVLIAMIGFWSNEAWGPRFIFYQAIGLFSGSLFPLDILPKRIAQVFQLLPFSYLTYFPSKLYLGQLTEIEIVKGFIILIIWIFVFWQLLLFVWRKGLRNYTAQGM
jgi:ABC-2 type transport system permease protein